MTTVYASPPYGYYWLVTDSSPSTQVWSADAGAFVVLADAGYTTWAATHTTPTYDTIANLLLGIDAYNKSQCASYNNGYNAQTITAATNLTNPIAEFNNLTNNTSDGIIVRLPQVNIPGGTPIGTVYQFTQLGNHYIQLNSFGDAATVGFVTGDVLSIVLIKNDTQAGTWVAGIGINAAYTGLGAYKNTLLYGQGQGWVPTNTANNGVLITSSSGVPSIGTVAQAQALLAYPVILGGAATAVDFNAIADTAITITNPGTKYRIFVVTVYNTGTTASLTAAQFGLFSAVTGGGQAVIATGTALSGITQNAINTTANQVSFNSVQTIINYATLYFRITQVQGAAASGNVYIWIQPIP